MPTASPTPWLTDARDAWLAEITRWASDQIERLGLGDVVETSCVRERPWGAVHKIVTSDRVLFGKAIGLGGRHETRLLADLSGPWPHLVPDVLAIDEERAWILMGDNGVPMWDVLTPAQQIDVYAELYPRYAEMQRDSTGLIDGWLAAAVPDRRMRLLPELLDGILTGRGIGDKPLPLEPGAREAMVKLVPAFERACAELAAPPFVDSLDHSDTHGGNVLVGASGHRLIDWGDASITDPFCTLFVTVESFTFGDVDASERIGDVLRLRDAYLEAWDDHGSRDELRSRLALSLWAGHIVRALDHVRMIDGSDEETAAAFRGDVVDYLAKWERRSVHIGSSDEMIGAILGLR